eukprot:NODE_58_length_2325_cov_377.525551.p1 GENE.NODE_58_length_2325_cov_377.525551~~NODE_58_length_2325_cov_377.525551.p1  ORF type:complete len:726 (+),score=314.25 NODE_58_length_2325_cov_377.525551:3-2180(+)
MGTHAMPGSRELLNVLGEVKARVQDKLGIADFPLPQFILIGKQSVGKSRLIETLAGETFNFISGTLGSRRPTVLEFRNVPGQVASKWFVRDRTTNQWQEHAVPDVMRLVGEAHEVLGAGVSKEPIYVRMESPDAVDLQIVDLPGFREFALDGDAVKLRDAIEELVMGFMRDSRNVMLCVEQAGDAATMSTLSKCREIDPKFQRTVLIRNKLDKYYNDLTPDNVNKWADGFGDLPEGLQRFALTLPWWPDGTAAPKPFCELRAEFNDVDMQKMQERQLSATNLSTVGFTNFSQYMEKKVESMFSAAIGPVLQNLRDLKDSTTKHVNSLAEEYKETDPNLIVTTTRDVGRSFASGLVHVMEGIVNSKVGRMTLEKELIEFHDYHTSLGSDNLSMLPSEDFCGLEDYLSYLGEEVHIGAYSVEVSGGAQFRRMMVEVEIFLRFSEIAVETKKRDVVQARGISMSSLTWSDVIVKLLSNEAHVPLQKRIRYVAERIKYFFLNQKPAIMEFMKSLEGSPMAAQYPAQFTRHVKLMEQNEMVKHLIFETYDKACDRQLKHFMDLFSNMLTSTFANPWVFLKGATTDTEDETPSGGDDVEAMKRKIPLEIQGRSGIEATLAKWLQDIPTDSAEIDEAVDKVQMLVLKTYSFIRSQVCDQVELFAESFFKVPMMRQLQEDMSEINLSDDNMQKYAERRERLLELKGIEESSLKEVDSCIKRLTDFKLRSEAAR